MGWVRLGWVKLGWVGLGRVGLGWVGLGSVGLGSVGLRGWAGAGCGGAHPMPCHSERKYSPGDRRRKQAANICFKVFVTCCLCSEV